MRERKDKRHAQAAEPPSTTHHNDTASLLDLLLSQLRDPAGLDNAGQLRQAALAEHLAVAVQERVDDGHLGGAARQALALLGGHERPELVEVDDGAVRHVARHVEVAHADLAEVAGVVLVEVGAVVVLTTGETTTTGVLAVLACTRKA